MNKIGFLFLSCFLSVLFVGTSCSSEELSKEEDKVVRVAECLSVNFSMGEIEEPTMGVKSYLNGLQYEGTLRFKNNWEMDDQVVIFPDVEGASPLNFMINKIKSDGNAMFYTPAWAMQDGTKYFSFSPYKPSLSLEDKTSIPFSYEGQFMPSYRGKNGDIEYLEDFLFLVAEPFTPSNHIVSIKYNPMAAIMASEFKLPQGYTYTKVEVSAVAGEKFVMSGNVDITSETYDISNVNEAASFDVDLRNMYVEEGAEPLYIVNLIHPIYISQGLRYTFYTTDGKKVVFETNKNKPIIDMVSGSYYTRSTVQMGGLTAVQSGGENSGVGEY